MNSETLENIDQSLENSQIRVVAQSSCVVCGNNGSLVHRGLTDKLFGITGAWNMRKCSSIQCSTLWLDPRPVEEDLGLLYSHYYTHDDENSGDQVKKEKYHKIIQALAYKKYGGKAIKLSFIEKCLSWLVYLNPARLADRDDKAMSIPVKLNGKLLEVGFGSGEYLQFLGNMGWQVEGIDFDAIAVKQALKRGLNVKQGGLAELRYTSDRYDAIFARHVIEHLSEPRKFLSECFRILSPGGRLILNTPNVDSLGYRFFKEYWRGLETPRHLNIFNCKGLSTMLRDVGFEVLADETTGRGGVVLYESYLLKKGLDANKKSRLIIEAANWLEWVLSIFCNKWGEELRVIAIKVK